ALVKSVNSSRGAAEQRGLFIGRRCRSDALERVPKRRVADPHLVDREIALERAAPCAKPFDARLDIRAPAGRQLLRRHWAWCRVVVERRKPHHHSTELHDDVRTGGYLWHGSLPLRLNLLLPAGERTIAQRHAGMVHDDRRIGTRTRQIDQVAVLWMIDQRIQRQPHGGQSGEARSKIRAQIESGTGAMVIVSDDRVIVPAGGVANAAQSTAARLDQGGEYRFYPVAEREVRESHDAGGDAGLDVRIALTSRRDACGEFDLADRAEFDRSFGSLISAAFDHDGCHNVVAGSSVGEIVLEEIAPWCFPEVMMAIDDGECRLQDFLRFSLSQPIFTRREDPAESFRRIVGTHLISGSLIAQGNHLHSPPIWRRAARTKSR